MESPQFGVKGKRFVRGVLLAWIPFLFLATPTVTGMFQAIWTERATEWHFVSLGLFQYFTTFGLAGTLVFEIAAIIFLLRGMHGLRPVRTVVAVISLCCSGFMLAMVGVGLFFWRTLLGLAAQ